MSSLKEKSESLVKDIYSLTRVRNRFSTSADQQLHTIMPALIPKLFQRLENYRTLIMNDDDDNINTKQPYLGDSILCFIKETKQNIHGIIANAMKRLRVNEIMPTGSLVRAMLPFIHSNSLVVGTWTMAFLEVSIQRIPLQNFSLISSLIPPLLESLGQLHKRLVQSVESPTIDGPLEARWISTSWLLLDSIVLHSGQKPMIDWDIDKFDKARTTQRMRSRPMVMVWSMRMSFVLVL